MYDRFNNFPIDISERASIPRSFDISIGMNSGEKLKRYLWDVIHNERANRKLYFRLMDAGINKPVLARDQAIELLPGKFIKVYFVLKDIRNKNKLFGTSRVTGLIFKESSITISLFADIDNDMIVWLDSYSTTIDHEITHAFQNMEVAIRYLYLKNRHIPNYTPSFDDVIKWMTKAGIKNKEILKKKNKNKSPEEKYLNYLSSDRELAAPAHALLRELYSKDKRLYDAVISFCEHGWPSFDTIDKELSKGKWEGWYKLTLFGDSEMKSWNIRYEETYCYALKHELLEKLYEIYKLHYK